MTTSILAHCIPWLFAAVVMPPTTSATIVDRVVQESAGARAARLGFVLAPDDSKFLSAALAPTAEDVGRAEALLSKWKSVHGEAMRAVQRIFAIEDVQQRRAAMRSEFERTDPSWPFEYTMPMRAWVWCGGDDATAAIAAGVSTDTDRGEPLARAWNLVRAAKYSEVKEVIRAEKYPRERDLAALAIDRLAASPEDLDSRLNWLDVLGRCDADALAIARLDFCWTLLDKTHDLSARAKIVERIAAVCGTSMDGSGDYRFKRDMIEATALLSGASQDPGLRASALSRLADGELAANHKVRAAVLFATVADGNRDVPDWGRSAFNTGFVLRELDHADPAIVYLTRLFDSDVDDKEPNTLLQPYRNYRHRAAVEISKAHESAGRFPEAYDWMLASGSKYPYESWCGTCLMGESQRLEAELNRLAAKAGIDRTPKKPPGENKVGK